MTDAGTYEYNGDEQYPWRDEDELRRLYHGERMSANEISKLFGCTDKTVGDWIDRLGIEKRSHSKATSLGVKQTHPTFMIDDRGYELVQSVHMGEVSRVRIHRLIAMSVYGFDTVLKNDVHHENGVKWDNRPSNLSPKQPGDHSRDHACEYWEKEHDGNVPWRDEDTLRRMYVDEGMTTPEIADELGCVSSTIWYNLKECGIETRHSATD